VRPRWLAVVCVLAGCGGSTASSTPTPTIQAPTETATAAPPVDASGNTGTPAINSVTVDPGDGTLMIGSGPALFRVAPGAKEAERLTGKLSTPQGDGDVSGNLVVRFTGPGKLLASGHPSGGTLPENLGLIRSQDHGETWEPVAQLGDADYHELEVIGSQIVGVKADSPDIQSSTDGGKTWKTSTPPAPPIDVVVDPADPQHWAVSTEQQGTFVSTNGGGSWRPRDTTFGARLAWPAKDALYSLDQSGKVRVSPDGGRSWQDRGNVGGIPSDFAAGKGSLYAAIIGGKIRTSRDGGKSWSTAATVR
jgi:hypothetical protein